MVFTPLSDGTYRKLLITYNFTPQEKKILLNGGHVNTKGKSTVTELGTETLPQVNKGSQNCGYTLVEYYTTCSSGEHSNGESTCNAGIKSYLISVYLYVCTSVDDGSGGGGGGSTGDGGGGDGPPIDWVCPNPQVLTGPQQPGSDVGDGGCYGVPTDPNVGMPPTPCEKLADLLSPTKANVKPLITNGMYSFLDNIGNNESETGIYLKKSSTGNITAEIAPPSGTNKLPPKYDDNYYSMIHTHPSTTYPMFSYSDIYVMYLLETHSANHNTGESSMVLVCEDESGVKQTYAIVFENTGTMMEDAWVNTPENAGCSKKELIDQMDDNLKLKYDEEIEKSYPNYERVFLQSNFGTNIGLYKANADLTGWSKLTINENSDTAVVTPTNCN